MSEEELEEMGPCWGDQPYCYTDLHGDGHCICWTADDPRNEGH